LSFFNNVLRVFFLSQTGVGALGNSFILVLYTITFFTGHRLRPIDLIITHLLAFVNDLVLLSKGIPQTMAAFGLNNFLDDVGCKLVFYLHRVAQGWTKIQLVIVTENKMKQDSLIKSSFL
uniref:Vomeronasal type-1 receptor n=1 Tax=Vombatus ursinus TaxID=29139 RepID=A0A4X2K709_VOMUR